MSDASHIQPALLGKMNEQQVLRLIQQQGPLSRADVSRLTGVSPPTISKAATALITSGFLEEEDAVTPRRGRPAKRLKLASRSSQVIGIVIDQPDCTIVSAGIDGVLHDTAPLRFPTPNDYDELLDQLANAVRQRVGTSSRMHSPSRTLGVGISLPGLVDRRERIGRLSPNVPVTNGHPLERDLRERLGLPIVMRHETEGLCLAEMYVGGARELTDFAVMDISTGVGLSVVADGRLMTGHAGYAGEIGHVMIEPNGRRCNCGQIGCLETVASDAALAGMLHRQYDIESEHPHNLPLLLPRIDSGELDPTAALDTIRGYLARGLAIVINLFNPSTLFVHGELLTLREGYFESVIEETRRIALEPSSKDCEIKTAIGSKSQGAIATILDDLTNALCPTGSS